MRFHMHRLVYGFLLLSWLLVVGGCAFGRAKIGEQIPEASVQAIQPGVTSKAEVVKLFGPPEEVSHTLNQEVFHYQYLDGKLGLFLIFSRANLKSDDLFIFFNPEGVVEEVVFGRRTDQLPFQFWPFGK